MYMSRINIQGFKSFGPAPRKGSLENLHPHLNVIVGAKDAGKTNIIYAAEFLLTNQLTKTNEEIRKNLLFHLGRIQQHNGTVHIEFAYTEEAMLSVRSMTRKISKKSDNLQVDDKLTDRMQVSNMLRAAGLDFKNWFYIVKQGKVHLMSSTQDDHRLNEIVRTFESHNYDEEKRKLQMTLRRNTDALHRTAELVNEYERQLDKYNPLKKSLEIYSQLETSRRAVEYQIRASQLYEIKQDLKKGHKKSISNQVEVKKLEKHSNLLTERLLKLEHTLNMKHKKLEYEITTIIKLITLQRLMATEKEKLFTAKQQKGTISVKKEILEEEANRYNVDITCYRQHIAEHQQQYDDYKQQQENCARRLLQNSVKEEILLTGHYARNLTPQEKKEHFENKIRQCEENIEQSRERTEKLQVDIEVLSNVKQQHKQDIKDYLEEQKDLQNKYDHLSTKLKALQEKCAKEEYEMRQENSTSQLWMKFVEFKFDIKMKEARLYCLYSQEIVDGFWNALELKEKLWNQCPQLLTYWYGSILEAIKDTPAELHGAVQSAGGIRLFYQIVKNTEVAEKLKEKFKENNFKGVVRFIILDNLKHKVLNYPDCEEVYPLLPKLPYVDNVYKAIQEVFGKVLCCEPEVMMEFSQLGYTCVSQAGTKVADCERGEAYKDCSVSLIQLFNEVMDLREDVHIPDDEMEDIDISELLNIESKLRDIKSQMEHQSCKIKKAVVQLETVKYLEDRKKERLSKNIDILKHQKLKRRMMTQHLSPEGVPLEDSVLKDQLTELVKERLTTNAEMKTIVSSMMELGYYKNKMKREKAEIECHKYEQQKSEIMLELKTLENSIREAKICIKGLKLSYETWKNVLYRLATEEEEEEEQGDMLEDSEKQQQKEIEKNLQTLKLENLKLQLRKYCLQETMTDLEDAIKDIQHSADWENISNILRHMTKDPKGELRDLNKQMKKCGITAVDVHNYNYIHDNWESASKRLQRLQNGITATQRMLKEKDRNRLPLLRSIFEAISKMFSSIFNTFVPEGKGNITFKEREGISEECDLSERFVAEITASMNSREQELQAMELLPENERTLIGLVLIITLQMVFKVPFCIFDDVELMLQPEYRPIFYDVVIEMAKHHQVLIVTKSHKLIQHADRCYIIKNIRGEQSTAAEDVRKSLQKHVPAISR